MHILKNTGNTSDAGCHLVKAVTSAPSRRGFKTRQIPPPSPVNRDGTYRRSHLDQLTDRSRTNKECPRTASS
ncbi:hypothetical protein J6590_089954 [Homalodisca vitripennis]|nr:hypothetical protein J6590_089954 [Homalodisca vitripennis]